MPYNKFRPQDMPKSWTIKSRLKGYDSTFDSYNFQTRVRWYPAGYRLNKQTIARTFSRLHYLACHSPKKVAIKYKSAYNEFETKHFARKGRTSVRYLNKWTAHSWL
jgi:hypothetical protein